MTISRRQFCAALGVAGLSATAFPVFATDSKTEPLRVITYNVYGCRGWPANRSLARKAVAKDQMVERFSMELALFDPDIINFSESPGEAVTKAIAKKLGMNHVRFPSGGNWPGTLLSRFEITDSENVPLGYARPQNLFTRHWGRGSIKLPTGAPLIVHSAHLYPVVDPTIRLKEINAMLTSMQDDFDSGQSMLLIGDLNHSPETEEYQLWKDAGWIDTFAKVGKGEGITFQADVENERIDYVMAYGPIANQIVESRPLFEGAFRFNLADENAFALSDHLPQLAIFGEQKQDD